MRKKLTIGIVAGIVAVGGIVTAIICHKRKRDAFRELDLYDDEDDDDYEEYDDDEDLDDEGEFDFGDETLYEVKCPTCGEVITLDEEMLDEGSTVCPSCGEELEFDLEGEEEED